MMKKIKLKELVSFNKGQQINGNELLNEGQYDYLNGGINPSGKWNDYNVEGNTIAISEGGNSCGYVNYMNRNFWCGAHCYYLFNIKCNVKYLFYNLKYNEGRLQNIRSGACMPNIKKKDLGDFEIFVDENINSQNKIVSYLDSISYIIQNRKKQIDLLDELIKSQFVEMFGNNNCEKKLLKNISKFQQGTQVPVEEQIEEYKDGYNRFLRIIDYTQAQQKPRYVSVKGRLIDEKSVVVVRYGATAGFVGRGYSGILANNLFEIIPDENIISKDFLYIALKYGNFENEINKKSFGAAMPALSFGMVEKIMIEIPPIELQNKFADFVKQINKQKFEIQKSLEETQKLKESLMNKSFNFEVENG